MNFETNNGGKIILNYIFLNSILQLIQPRFSMSFQLDTILEVLLSPDNQRRIQAQNFVNQIPSTNFQEGLQAFLNNINHQNPQIASMSALLLKKKYIEIKENFSNLSVEQLNYIVQSVQKSMDQNKPTMLLKRCCDILVKIYVLMNSSHEIIKLIQSLSNAQTNSLKTSLFYLIQISCESAFDDTLMLKNASILDGIFQKGMNDQSNQIRASAFKTLTIFLSCITDEKLVKKFDTVLQLLIAKAIQLVKYDQDSGVTAIESLNELIQSHPKFIKPILNDLLSIYTQIMQASALLINLRTTAMHGVLLLCINHPSSIRKSEYFKTKMVPTYMKLLSEIQGTSMQQWLQELDNEIISKNDIAQSTQEHLSQINNELTNKFLLPIFIPLIQQGLASNNISFQHSALVAMALLTEGCHDSFKKQLNYIISLIQPLMSTQNPRLMHDILMVIGYMSQEFAPEIQTVYGDMILNFIIVCLKFPALKVQYMAIHCIQNFEKGITQHKQVKIMEKYLPAIMVELETLFNLGLSKMNYNLLDALLETITTIADMNPFQNYYGTFMPGLKKIISMLSTETQLQVMVRSRTVETMGYLLASVKDHNELFEPDCKEIMDSLCKISQTLDKDDPLFRSIFVVYENVVTCLKQNFVMYSDFVFPQAIGAANRKIEFTIIDETETKQVKNPNKNNLVKMKIDLKIDGVKNIVMNTDTLTQKIEATNLLVQMAQDMGENFGKYIEQSIPTVVELISFKNCKQIRNNMIQMIKYMMRDCVNNDQKSFVLQGTFNSLCSELSLVIRGKDNTQMASIVESMAEMMPSMSQQMINKLPEMMIAVLTLVKSLTVEVEKIYTQKQMDETLQEQMDNEIQQIQQSLTHVQKIIDLAKGVPIFENLRKLFPAEYQFD